MSLRTRALARTVAGQAAFLTAFAACGTVTEACRASRIGRRTVYDWLADDEHFARAFDGAREDAADLLEAECRRRGVDGVVEPVYHHGPGRGVGPAAFRRLFARVAARVPPDRFTGRRGPAGTIDRGGELPTVRVTYDHIKPDDPA